MAAHKYCEITKAISDLSSSSSSSDDSDFDEIFSNATSTASHSTTGKQQKTTPRLPTRRPDPNVCNRNALLARENRRKKKEYVATLEKELDSMKSTNKKLSKLLRKQVKFVRRLENEKQYYKSLISNQSDILNLVSVLNTKTSPISDASSCSPTDSNRSTSSLEPSSVSYDFNDNDSSYEPYSESHWDQLLGMDDNTPLPEEDSGFYPIINSRCEVQSNISGEHNYFNNIEDDSGLCLHMARGKASHEYCPSCHTDAKRFPDQLLVVD